MVGGEGMIDNEALKTILTEAKDISCVAEFYSADAVPTDDGFDPINAIGKFAAVNGITFRGVEYTPLVEKFGRISKSMTESTNSASVSFSNVTRLVAAFEFGNGFEGLIMVIRLLSRGRSVALSDTQILFAGRCERPNQGDKESLSVSAKSVFNSTEVVVPRRTYGPIDFKGRVSSDPEFEGFVLMPQFGTVSYTRIEKRGGFLGWWNKKEVRATTQWSSYSLADADKPVPECFGRVQIQAVLIGADDQGDFLRMRLGWCEGQIQDVTNIRSIDPAMPINPGMTTALGLPGIANFPDEPQWTAPGYYSRTAVTRCGIINLDFAETEAAPECVGVIEGKIITTPDANGVWNTEAGTDNAAAVVRYFWTSEDYFGLDPAWIDDGYSTECWNFNAEQLFNTSLNTFVFVEEG